ncbi:MaoC/PaaZ C-terminal domain-containing protein [Maricaulis sp.]|uniref:MaoC/PaaZ C-terminal domain-containing protein n=1 Tax=Maricaulis sp. TaxID=1486257 RepID=UPI0025D876E4|nr:MaoC/PaaZ C-terminal domain-containing protein [Maricaulis sp.]MDF1768744.1 MaoC/PaaZ C-terminal domain-containing protein [Maricaulis sp.]
MTAPKPVPARDHAVLDRTFSQADFNAFARLSGDDNPIHVDPEFSARTRFGRTVAHGALLCSVLRGLVETIMPGGRQLRQNTQYPAPSPAGEALRFEAETVGETEHGVTIALKVTRLSDGVITCLGETEVTV